MVREQLSENGLYPVYQNSLTPLGYHTDSNMPSMVPFVIGAGAAGEIGFSYVEFWAADDCFCFISDSPVSNRYLYYWLEKSCKYLKAQVRKSSVPRLSHSIIENLPIDVPSLVEQEHIVEILDKLYALCNDLSSGLPAEIAARQKQYEYYRDKLLTFALKEEK